MRSGSFGIEVERDRVAVDGGQGVQGGLRLGFLLVPPPGRPGTGARSPSAATLKHLSWSGPCSSSTWYRGVPPYSRWATCCRSDLELLFAASRTTRSISGSRNRRTNAWAASSRRRGRWPRPATRTRRPACSTAVRRRVHPLAEEQEVAEPELLAELGTRLPADDDRLDLRHVAFLVLGEPVVELFAR